MKKAFIYILINFFLTSVSFAQNFNGGNDDGHATSNQTGTDASSLSHFGFVKNVSSSNNDGTYKITDVITIEITFDRLVFVSGGTPLITLETGTTDRLATYYSGSNSKTLSFTYTVQNGDNSNDLSYLSTNINLNTSTITDILGNNINTNLPTSGNSGSLSANKNIVIDGIKPSVEITQASGQTDPTNSSPINFTATFSESVTGFDNSDIILSGTATPATVVVTGSGVSYNIAVSGMSSDGSVIIDIPADICTDAAGNLNTAATNTDNTVTYDIAKPTVEITQASEQTDPTNSSPINFSATFSESVTGFDNSDIILSGTANPTTIVVTGSGATYNIAVSGMSTSGSVIIDIPADVCADAAGNLNTAATNTDNTVSYDTGKPTVEITQASGQTDPTNSSPINFTATFSESVTGFDNSDIILSGTANPTTVVVTGSGANYNIAVSGMSSDGSVIIDIPADICADAAGNLNTAATNTDNTVTYDIAKPTVEITQASEQTDPTNSSPINFSATFSESVTGFDNSDIILSGTATPTTVVVTGSGVSYNIAVSGMSSDGNVIIDIPADVCVDAAGNLNTAATNTDNIVIYDNTKPSIIISSLESGSTELTNIPITIEFSEQVQGFEINDISSTNASLSGLTEISIGKKWTVSLIPTNPGLVEMSIQAGIAIDIANNSNLVSNLFSINYVLAPQAPLIENQQFNVSEDSEAGTLIGTVIATDVNNDNISFELISDNSDGTFSIDFNNGEISLNTSDVLNYEKQTEYLLTVEVTDDSPDALSAQADIKIVVLDVDEPFVANNIITPNDIRNKYWIIKNVHNYTDFELTIRTATGQIVYKTLNYQNDWAGTYNNKELPTGTYYYTLISIINKKTYSGYINLIRN